MAWILNRAGQQQQEGPYEDAHIIHLIQTGSLRDGFICQPGGPRWMALAEHPPFAQALGQGGAPGRQQRSSGTMVFSSEPEAPGGGFAGHDAPPAASHGAASHGAAPHSAASHGATPYGAAPQGAAPYGAASQEGWGAPGAYAQPPAGSPAFGAGGGPSMPQAGVAGQAPGAPPPGWGGASAALPPVDSRAAPAKAKKGGMGKVIGILAAIVGLVVAGAVAMLLLTGAGSKFSEFVPDDVLVFVEFPSTVHALKGALDVDSLNTSKLDADKQLQTWSKAVGDAFALDKDKAESLVLSIDGAALAMRRQGGRDQFVVMLAFRDDDAVVAWLESERVTKQGKFGSSGERYFVVPAKKQPAPDANAVLKSLSAMEVQKDSERDAMVWFAGEKLLVFGQPDIVDDVDSVLTKGDGSLAQAEEFKAAKFDAQAAVLGFVSSDVLDELKGEEQRKLIQGYLNGIKAFTFDSSFVDAGLLTTMSGQLKGDRITEDERLPDAVALTLQDSFPTGTVGYLALGTQKTEDGKTLKTRLLKQLRATDEGAGEQLDKSLEELEKGAGVSFEQIIDAIGNQLAVGVVVDTDFKLDGKTPPTEQLDKLALLVLAEVGKEEAAEDVVKQLRLKLFEEGPLKLAYDIKEQGAGFQGLAKDPKAPTVQVFFHDGKLLIGVGGKQVLAKGLLALGGKDSLGTDAAHSKAVGALGAKPRTLLWVDSGRIAKAALDALPEGERQALEEAETQFGVSHEAIQLEGDDRLTAAAAVFIDAKAEAWDYRFEALNAPSLGVLAALGTLSTPAPPLADAVNPPPFQNPGGLFLPQTGVPQCDGLLLVMSQCADRTQDPQLGAEARALELRFKTDFADPSRKAAGAGQCTQQLVQFMTTNSKCAGN